jgi:hypothetical protein
MRFGIAPIILLLVVFTIIQAQDQNTTKGPKDNARIFLSTFTIILSTVTSTATATTVTTCTTSAGALITCSAGRRRRGLLYEDAENDGRSRRGLFYDEDETELKDGSISISDNPVKRCSIKKYINVKHSSSRSVEALYFVEFVSISCMAFHAITNLFSII